MSFVQTTIPLIKFSRVSGSYVEYSDGTKKTSINTYKTLNENKVTIDECLINYNFSRSIANFGGEFTLTVKDNKDGSFIDDIQPLDIVTISESNIDENDIDFIGVITRVSFSANANGLQRQLNISGKSIEYLMEYLTISEDVTAMSLADKKLNDVIENMNVKLAIVDNAEKKTYKSTMILDAIKASYDAFCKVANNAGEEITNTEVINIIDTYYGSEKFITTTSNFKYKYPITNNMFGKNSTVTIIGFIKDLLPSNVYETFGTIIDGKPKIMVRQVPFGEYAWNNLDSKFEITSDILINYTVTKSIEEVYTAFMAYLQNSPFSSDFNLKTAAASSSNGSPTNYVNDNKRKKYGFKLLQTNFVGYTNTEEDLIKIFSNLNKDLSNYYSRLDEMLDATITVVNDTSKKASEKARIGDKVKFLGGEFYITGEEHTWNYGQSGRITYHCERGGIYTPGNTWEGGFFKPLKNVSKALREVSN